jgi:GrpB-like predicted nucleotidyltransferase (UPF0157 family)
LSELDRHLDEVLVGGQRPVVVELSPYDPAWPAQFAQHRDRITGAVGEVEVEHVGSTSVAGLAAKPVIDVQLVVDDLDASVAALEPVGYALRVREPGHRVVQGLGANVHLYDPGDPEPMKVRRFRDLLRADPEARQRYEAVKRSLTGQQWPDMNHYAAAKSDVIAELLDGATELTRK